MGKKTGWNIAELIDADVPVDAKPDKRPKTLHQETVGETGIGRRRGARKAHPQAQYPRDITRAGPVKSPSKTAIQLLNILRKIRIGDKTMKDAEDLKTLRGAVREAIVLICSGKFDIQELIEKKVIKDKAVLQYNGQPVVVRKVVKFLAGKVYTGEDDSPKKGISAASSDIIKELGEKWFPLFTGNFRPRGMGNIGLAHYLDPEIAKAVVECKSGTELEEMVAKAKGEWKKANPPVPASSPPETETSPAAALGLTEQDEASGFLDIEKPAPAGEPAEEEQVVEIPAQATGKLKSVKVKATPEGGVTIKIKYRA
ncbi:MAG: hypothetical protein ABIC19_04610 [Patescibacteria group bacterium]